MKTTEEKIVLSSTNLPMEDKDKAVEILKWLIFSIAVAVLPLLVVYLNILTEGGKPTLNDITGHGELALISIAVGAEAFSCVFGSFRNYHAFSSLKKIWHMIVFGGLFLLILLSSIWYGSLAKAFIDNELKLSYSVISNFSLLLFFATLATGFSCKMFEE